MADPNPKKAYGDKKLGVQFVPPALLLETSVAFKEGARKYGPFNWRQDPVEVMTYVGAIGRHLAAFTDGEDIDPESEDGKTHLAGIAACCAILMDAKAYGTLIDNRVKGPAPEMTRTPTSPELPPTKKPSPAKEEKESVTCDCEKPEGVDFSVGFISSPWDLSGYSDVRCTRCYRRFTAERWMLLQRQQSQHYGVNF